MDDDDDESNAYFPLPHQAIMNNNARQDPIRPIDPRQWIAQTNAVFMRRRSSLSPPPPASSTLSSSPSNSPQNNNDIKSKYDFLRIRFFFFFLNIFIYLYRISL
jgi:hypothetical protein